MLFRSRAPATLRFVFHVPEEILPYRPAVNLSASINGQRLPPATYSTAGEHEYTGVLKTLAAGEARVEFELDAAFRPADGDRRELGVLVDFSGEPPIALG